MIGDITASESVSNAIREWMSNMMAFPNWREWKSAQIDYILSFDDEVVDTDTVAPEFKFSDQMELEHSVIMSYLELLSTAAALHEVEWYFRRYPFSNAPVSRGNHLKNCCEMFFGRFYQFRERLKKLSKAVAALSPDHEVDFGKLIKLFDKEFDQEIRARHGVHHNSAFDEVGIARIELFEHVGVYEASEIHLRALRENYRKTTKEWATRTRQRSEALDRYLEAVAEVLLICCPFLVELKE